LILCIFSLFRTHTNLVLHSQTTFYWVREKKGPNAEEEKANSNPWRVFVMGHYSWSRIKNYLLSYIMYVLTNLYVKPYFKVFMSDQVAALYTIHSILILPDTILIRKCYKLSSLFLSMLNDVEQSR